MTFFREIEKSILKFMWKHKRLKIVKAIMSQNSNARYIIILDFKLYHRAMGTTSMVLPQKQTCRPMEQNKMPRYKLTQHSHFTLGKDAKIICWRKDSLFNICCWEN
jgi:hypothetical protein